MNSASSPVTRREPSRRFRTACAGLLVACGALAACASDVASDDAASPDPRLATGAGATPLASTPPAHRAAILRMQPADGDGDESGSCNPSTKNLTNTGPGPVMHNARYHLIFWLPSGTHFTSSATAQEDTYYEAYLQNFFSDVSSSPLFGILSQYTDTSGAPGALTDGGSWTYATAYPNGKGSTSNPLRDSDIQNAITASLGSGGPGWTASNNDVFFVFTGASIQSCLSSDNSVCTFSATLSDGGTNSQYGAYHAAYSYNGANVIYANMPAAATIGYYTNASAYPNDPAVDPTITAASHELFESITDPLLNSWKGPNGNCDEVADKCNLNMGPAVNFDGSNLVMSNGHRYVAQEEWSNLLATAAGASAGCTMGVAPPAAPGCTPSSGCNSEYFPAGYGTPVGYHLLETVSVSCNSTPSVLQESVGGSWVSLPPFVANAGYPGTTTADVFDIGTQSATGQTTSGAAVGSSPEVRACAITNAGTTCDSPSPLEIADCCVPLTACESGMCGSTSNGCGGTIQCGGCSGGDVCEDGMCTCVTPECLCEDKGDAWVDGSCLPIAKPPIHCGGKGEPNCQ